MTFHVKPLTLQNLISRMTAQKPFAFSRYGNGEWGCLLGTHRRTGSGSHSLKLPGLRHRLASSILNHATMSDDYWLGMQSLTYLERCGLLRKIEKWNLAQAPKATWYAGEVLHKASMRSQLNPLIRQMRKMKVIVVGPSWLRQLGKKAFKISGFVEVARQDCFKDYPAIKAQLFKEIIRVGKSAVISFSAGPPAKILIGDVFDKFGNKHFLVDFGSMWDPYCGKHSRKYHSRITQEVQRRNLAT